MTKTFKITFDLPSFYINMQKKQSDSVGLDI